jgi:hypothetical protein
VNQHLGRRSRFEDRCSNTRRKRPGAKSGNQPATSQDVRVCWVDGPKFDPRWFGNYIGSSAFIVAMLNDPTYPKWFSMKYPWLLCTQSLRIHCDCEIEHSRSLYPGLYVNTQVFQNGGSQSLFSTQGWCLSFLGSLSSLFEVIFVAKDSPHALLTPASPQLGRSLQ